jgi:hypothetical protein
MAKETNSLDTSWKGEKKQDYNQEFIKRWKKED